MFHLITGFLNKMDGPDRKDTRERTDSHDLRARSALAQADTDARIQTGSEAVNFRFCPFFVTPQINLQRRMRVTGLITQGAKRIGSPEYVKSYKVAYSDDGKTWRTYKVKGKDEDMVRHTRVHAGTPDAISPLFAFSRSLCVTHTKLHTRPRSHTCTHSD